MEISTEISQKIRSAIKAKLIELGAYVDDELPDYIMVMVANKKTQQQMTDDLNLFLGVNTEKFTTWLHSLLKKLQSINSSEPQPPAKEKHKQKHEKSGKHDKHDKPDKQDKSDKTKSVKRKRSHSEKTKSSDSGKHKKTSGEATAVDSAGVTKHKRHSTESADTTEASSQKRKHSTDAGEATEVVKQKKSKSVEISSKGDKAEGKKAVVAPEKQEKKEGDDEKAEINIMENTDEFSEEIKVEEKTETKKPTKIAIGAKAAKPEAAKPEKEKDAAKQKTSKTKDKGEKSKESSKHKPSSVVGTVKRKFVDEEEDEEEYDPLNPAVGTVASAVRAPARKSSVPKSLQANRSLLMKAVSDAEKSVKDLKKDDVIPSKPVQKVSPDLRGRLKTAAGLQLVSKSRRKETLESMKYIVDNTEESEKLKVSKSREKEGEKLKDLKLTVKNEDVPAKKKRISPKSKAPPVAPARVAQEALRSISKNKPVLTKTIQQDDNEDSEGPGEEGDTSDNEELTENGDTEDNSEDISDVESADDEDDADNGDVDENESVEEIEIEVIDRAMQTEAVKIKEDIAVKSRSAQTENKHNIEDDAVRIKLATEKVKEIDSNLADMVIDSLIPVNLVQQDSFKTFCKSLEAKYHLPKVKKLAGEIKRRFDDAKCQLEKELKDTDSVALTHNTWSTVDDRHYCTVMANFVTNKWNQISVTLGTFEVDKDRVDSAARNLKNVVVSWKLPNTVLVTGLDKHELIMLESLGIESVACLGQFLRILIKDCLDHKLVSSLVEKGRNFISALQSLCDGSELKKHQKADLSAMLEFHKLCLDEPSKWNTTVDMLSSLSDQAETIRDVVNELNINDGDIDNSLYSDDDVNFVKCLVTILSQFKTAVEILTASDTTTAEKRLPTLIKLRKSIAEDVDDRAFVASLKSEIRKQINSLIMHNKESLLLSCIIHPQTKQLMFVSPEEMTHAKLLLFDKMTEIMRMKTGGPGEVKLKKVDEEMSDGGSKPVSQDQSDNSKKDSSKRKTHDSKYVDVKSEIGEGKETKEPDEVGESLEVDSLQGKTETAQGSSDNDNEKRIDRGTGLAVNDSKSGILSENQTDVVNIDKHATLVEEMADTAQSDCKTETHDVQKAEKISESIENISPQLSQTNSEKLVERKEDQIESGDPESGQTEAFANTINRADIDSSDNQYEDNSKSTEASKSCFQNKPVIGEDIKEDSDKLIKSEKPETDSKPKASSKTSKTSKVDKTDWLEDVIGSGKSHAISPEQKAKVELDLYLAEPALKTSAFDWWKEKQSVFPTVSQVARSFLAIPASGISLEDVMNLNDDAVDAKKSQIDPKHLDAVLFLNKNKGILSNKEK